MLFRITGMRFANTNQYDGDSLPPDAEASGAASSMDIVGTILPHLRRNFAMTYTTASP